MKTYTKTAITTEPLLVIEHDEDSTSPREWSNLGYFITVDSRYDSPDKSVVLENIVKSTGMGATSQADHIAMIIEEIENTTEENVLAIYPIVKYEHGGVVYRLGSASGFDYSNNGFYIITDKTQKEVGVKKKDFEKVIKEELEVFNKWCNGDIYRFTLYKDNGELEDSCSGFYSVEEIRDSLPKEWKKEDLSVYVK
jgi:hypothetical protein